MSGSQWLTETVPNQTELNLLVFQLNQTKTKPNRTSKKGNILKNSWIFWQKCKWGCFFSNFRKFQLFSAILNKKNHKTSSDSSSLVLQILLFHRKTIKGSVRLGWDLANSVGSITHISKFDITLLLTCIHHCYNGYRHIDSHCKQVGVSKGC